MAQGEQDVVQETDVQTHTNNPVEGGTGSTTNTGGSDTDTTSTKTSLGGSGNQKAEGRKGP